MLALLFMFANTFAQSKMSMQSLPRLNPAVAGLWTKQEVKQQPSKKALQKQHDTSIQKAARMALKANKKAQNNVLQPLARKNNPARRAGAVITDQPEGDLVIYNRSGSAYYPFFGYIYETDVNFAIGKVVFGANNKVYMKNVVTQYSTNTWIEGTLNGSVISFEFPQTALDLDGEYYYFQYGSLDEETMAIIPSDKPLSLNYDLQSGNITTSEGSDFESGQTMVALVDEDGYIAGYCDWNITMKKNTDTLVEAPEGLQTATYSISAADYSGSLVQVGFKDNDVYVQGLDVNLPDTWVKGTISGNKVIFKNNQYIGPDEVAGYHQYMCAAKIEQVYDEYYGEYYDEYELIDSDIEFSYDAATKSLSGSSFFLINAGTETVNYQAIMQEASISPFVEVAATPAAPTDLVLNEYGWEYYFLGYGWGEFDFSIPTQDVNGNFILPEKISYQLYAKVNGEVMPITLSNNDYMYFEEPMTEVPYDYLDGYDIGGSGSSRYLYYYIIGPEAYGLQTIYRGAGEERRSEIAWAKTEGLGSELQPAAATPAYPGSFIKSTDNSIVYSYYLGDEEINIVTNNAKAETYDVAIKVEDDAMEGNYITDITFPLQEVAGVSNISVFLTSQLRVENGKNAADLVVKSVTPAEPGFITVKLDKPYLIPEDGVYVGYSMTIDDVSAAEANSTPIAISDQAKEDAFYLHTSDGFLKWLDVSEAFGGSSLISVTVVGSSIKGNAANVKGEQQYVMTGKAAEVPLTVVNLGGKSIESIDIQYTLAGQTSTQHIDLQLTNIFGASGNIELNIPAIPQRGEYPLSVCITKVNGVDNEQQTLSSVPIIALNVMPKKRSLLEEYTGLWCGWCPRGYVALEKLAKLYPDEYVLVSYHNGDEMEIMDSESFPSDVAGFPDAYIDRAMEVDPYYGSGNDAFGVANDLAAFNKNFGMADINISSALTAAGVVSISSELTFPFDLKDADYTVEYILVADGLTNPTWLQSNYYSGGEGDDATEAEDMAMFLAGESSIAGLAFNDIAIMTSEMADGSGNEISEATADVPVKFGYEFNLAEAVSTSDELLVDKDTQLKVVVLLKDAETGAIINANKCPVGGSTVGLSELISNKKAQSETYFDLSGRKMNVAPTQRGIYIANGKKVVVK